MRLLANMVCGTYRRENMSSNFLLLSKKIKLTVEKLEIEHQYLKKEKKNESLIQKKYFISFIISVF